MYPIALQAFVDLFFVGLATCVDSVLHYRSLNNSTMEVGQWQGTVLHCVCSFGFSIMNEISTPMTMLALAIQRFFIVCKPFVANQPTFSKYILWGNIAITVIPLLLMIPNIITVLYLRHDGRFLEPICYAGMFVLGEYRNLFGSIIFFGVPALVCVVLYIFIGRALLKMRTMEARNRCLTLIFMVSCLLWFLFWLPDRFLNFYWSRNITVNDMSDVLARGKFYFFFITRRDVFTRLFSLCQPVVVILSYRSFKEPLVTFYKKVREKCGGL